MPATALAGTFSKRFWSVAAALVAISAVVFALVSVSNAPTARADTLLSDTFEDGNLDGWTRSGGSWSVTADGSQVARQSSTSSDARALAGQSTWSNYAVQARVKALAFNGSDRFTAVLARAQSNTSYYYLTLRSSNTVQIKKLASGSSTTLSSTSFTVTTGTFYTLRLEVNGSTLRGFVNGTQVGQATDTQFGSGRAGLATFNASASFDDVLVETTTGTPPTTTTTTTTTTSPGPGPQPPAGIMGYATLNGLGQNGTTGGAGGPTVTVTTASALISEINAAGPRTVRVQGMITVPSGMHEVSSDKTIIGVGSNSGISGGGFNVGLAIDDDITSPPANAVHNVIIRNLIFEDANDDSINVQMFTHHVWIDHNTFRPAADGSVDIKRGSDFATVSWNHFDGTDKTMLLGRDDSDTAQDSGRLRVTYHNNWFDETTQRNPRTRFGNVVHVLNNYYGAVDDYGVASTMQSAVLVEGNYFENTESPCELGQGSSPAGALRAVNNVFVGSGSCATGGSVGGVPYSYTPQNPNNVKASVTAGAGVGRI
ncbi:MAG TPA: family 16 glycoside hydrolase [Actinophytocola sp.]|uniref:pectate lyase family protein n=1 Tax=Actinophytocola sp. TaxID=1872138 RepID=UPI002DB9197F|nr:family 16 glycoside hydrolase [Actinophytocola sp.]HEU5475546.1 family 16 glycoside hydrolase [Actinophytocola sp.]